MTMLFAPVLQDVAARMAGAGPQASTDPVQQAYRLRDAVELAGPDWVITHHDPGAEAAAVRAAGGDSELVDVTLADLAPVSGFVEVVEILAKLYPDSVIGASVTGPAALAAALADGEDVDLLDCGDVLAELVSAYVGAGANRVVVWETDVPAEMASEVAGAHTAIVRRLEMLGVSSVLCGAPAVDSAGYAAHALEAGGRGALLVPGSAFAPGAAECFGELWQRWSGPGTRHADVVLTDGPVLADCDMGLLSSAGARRADGRNR